MTNRLLTPELAQRVQEVIRLHMDAAAAVLFGPDVAPDPDAWKLALGLGLVDPTQAKPRVTQDLFTFGVFLAHVQDAAKHDAHYGTTATEFLEAVRRDPIPLTDDEKHAAKFARLRAAEHVRGLGNRIGATIGSTLIEADADLRAEQQSIINDAIGAKYGDNDAAKRMRERAKLAGKDEDFYDNARRATIKRIASDIGHASKDWSRDLTRIVQTEAERAIQEGMTETWRRAEQQAAEEEKRPVQKILAYKIPRPDACPHCQKLHLEGGFPRIFHLDELVGNGTNVGRRASEWKATIGPVHPYCACALVKLPRFIVMPKGWTSGRAAPAVVDADGRLVTGRAS